MARKRISGPKPEFLGAAGSADAGGIESKSMFGSPSSAPISQIVADGAAQNALNELVEDMARHRAEGRFVLKIPLTDIVQDHLARDRVNADTQDMQALIESLREHGQRTPIEVTLLPDVPKGAPKYGLISGWRRLLALEQLYRETGNPAFQTILALQRAPADAAAAYVSMVEENEIRVGLSYYERARVAAEATKRGVFETEKQALLTLFATASRAKRSRIRSFITLYHALDGVLKYPAAIPERLGLSLVEALRKAPDTAERIVLALQQDPDRDAAREVKTLVAAIQPVKPQNVPRAEHSVKCASNGLKLVLRGNRIEITGEQVSPELLTRLKQLLEETF